MCISAEKCNFCRQEGIQEYNKIYDSQWKVDFENIKTTVFFEFYSFVPMKWKLHVDEYHFFNIFIQLFENGDRNSTIRNENCTKNFLALDIFHVHFFFLSLIMCNASSNIVSRLFENFFFHLEKSVDVYLVPTNFHIFFYRPSYNFILTVFSSCFPPHIWTF